MWNRVKFTWELRQWSVNGVKEKFWCSNVSLSDDIVPCTSNALYLNVYGFCYLQDHENNRLLFTENLDSFVSEYKPHALLPKE